MLYNTCDTSSMEPYTSNDNDVEVKLKGDRVKKDNNSDATHQGDAIEEKYSIKEGQ